MNKKIIVPLALVAVMVLAMVGAASAASADEEVTSVGSVEVRGTIAELDVLNPTIAIGAPLHVADYDWDPTNGADIPGFQWDYSSFAGFWYDLDDDLQTEHLTILQTPPAPGNPLTYPGSREIAEGGLIYTTHPEFQEYEMHQDIPDPTRTKANLEQTDMEAAYDGDGNDANGVPDGSSTTDRLDRDVGLCVESGNAGGDCGYFIEGWMAEKYVAIDGNADELCKLLVEFEDDDKKTLSTGEEWDLGGGFSLTANQIDLEGDKVWFSLKKDGRELDNEVASTGAIDRPQERVYTYTADIGGEDDIPVFSCYVDAVFRGTDSNVVQVMYVFLIDDDVLEIETSDTYGAMEVMTASSAGIRLTNDETTIDLDLDTTEHIMGNLYFKTADDDVNDNIRFYPYVEYTEPGTYEVRGTIAELDVLNPTIAIGAPLHVADYDWDPTNGADIPGFQWDYSSFAGFWYDLDDDLQTEHLTILQTPPAPGNPLTYPGSREIAEGGLIYTTHPEFQEYEMHQDIPDPTRTKANLEQTDMEAAYDGDGNDANGVPDGSSTTDRLDRDVGLCVESGNAGGDCGYFIEGWMAEKYVAIDGNADELCKLLVEFEDDDKKTLSTGEEWDLGGGFSLTANQIDLEGDKVWFSLKKDGRELDNEVASTGAIDRPQERVYTYTADIGGEDDIPVFSCYVDAVFRGTDSNVVQVMYVFLIDDDVLEIETSDTYGAMEVMTASSAGIRLTNDETTIDLDLDTTEHIMGNLYFKTADDDVNDNIRFYPYVEYTIGEGVVAAEEEEEPPTEVETPEANVTPTEVVTPAPEPTAAIAEETAAVAEETAAPAEEPTKKKAPGFEAVFAIAGLLAVAYLVLRQRE